MHGIFSLSYIYHKNQPNVGKYTSPMDAMGKIKKTSQFCFEDAPVLRTFKVALHMWPLRRPMVKLKD